MSQQAKNARRLIRLMKQRPGYRTFVDSHGQLVHMCCSFFSREKTASFKFIPAQGFAKCFSTQNVLNTKEMNDQLLWVLNGSWKKNQKTFRRPHSPRAIRRFVKRLDKIQEYNTRARQK